MDDTQLAHFTVELETDCPPSTAIRRVLDLRRHSRVIPFTTVTPSVPADSLSPGTRFVARTSLGPVGFDDAMRVDTISLGDGLPTASARISKESRAIRGSIRLLVSPTAAGSLVRWDQDVSLPWLPGFLQRPAASVLRLGYRQVLSRLLRGSGHNKAAPSP
ncbi:hypothetical protein LKO27_10095 [Tessaracoccus sp. OS52]|uniref:hypothetical protein n=1 Tax=Tessaracoccus sp. OS52 TaxID=2886691 RepID=UPI001D11AAAC|nr:hypothetical protein [Tessaracoccus sp. OS52]MCC2593755.1 hypothetical protein [Tessaracoccus sp. OS52]